MSFNLTSGPSLTARVTCYTFVDMAMGVLRILSMVALLSAETRSLSLFLPLFMALDAVGTHLRPDSRACEGKRTVIKEIGSYLGQFSYKKSCFIRFPQKM